MKKKALLASAIALVTASAMTFAPVSYKVIDHAYAAPVKQEVAAKLGNVLSEIEKQDKLKAPYNAMLEQLGEDLDQFNLTVDDVLPNLALALDEVADVDADKVQKALIELIIQLTEDYHTGSENFSGNLKDISEEAEEKLQELQDELGSLGNGIDRNVLADLLASVEAELIKKAGTLTYTKFDEFQNIAQDALKAAIKEEWGKAEAEQNKIVSVLVSLYESIEAESTVPEVDGEEYSFTIFKADLDSAKEQFELYVDGLADADQVKSIYKHGAAALAIGYAKYYFENEQPPLLNSYTQSTDLIPKLLIKGFPLSALNWSAVGDASVELNSTTGILSLTVNRAGTATITATLKQTTNLVPAAFDGVVLFSQEVNVGQASYPPGVFVPTPELGLVSDYQAKAAAISGLVADYLEANPDLFNNTLKRALIKQLEEQLRQALTVQAANAVTVSNGVSTLNITPAQMTTVYDTQLNTVLNALKAALEEQKLDLNISPVLTYNIGATSNGEVNLSKDLIDSLTSKEIAYVGVKTGDASVEASLDQLTAASKVSIKKAASTVAGAKSDTYSIAITNTNGDITGFEKQYRVTLPVNGTGSNVTVAKLGDGTQSLIGGQYDSKTRTITFFTNVLGDFVVVENSASFNDTANITWANDKIKLLADKGLLLGKGNGKFDPHGNVTRAEFTAMLVRTLNLNATTNITFNDVSENAWYYDSIAAARAYGIINGRSASEFDPNAQISREEMASIASNALKTVLDFEAPANAEEILNGFVDAANVVAVHRANVALLANEGIVQGKGKNNYDPKGTATRAESAVIIAKLFDLR